MIKNLDYNYLEVKVLKTDYRELLPIFDYFEEIGINKYSLDIDNLIFKFLIIEEIIISNIKTIIL